MFMENDAADQTAQEIAERQEILNQSRERLQDLMTGIGANFNRLADVLTELSQKLELFKVDLELDVAAANAEDDS